MVIYGNLVRTEIEKLQRSLADVILGRALSRAEIYRDAGVEIAPKRKDWLRVTVNRCAGEENVGIVEVVVLALVVGLVGLDVKLYIGIGTPSSDRFRRLAFVPVDGIGIGGGDELPAMVDVAVHHARYASVDNTDGLALLERTVHDGAGSFGGRCCIGGSHRSDRRFEGYDGGAGDVAVGIQIVAAPREEG